MPRRSQLSPSPYENETSSQASRRRGRRGGGHSRVGHGRRAAGQRQQAATGVEGRAQAQGRRRQGRDGLERAQGEQHQGGDEGAAEMTVGVRRKGGRQHAGHREADDRGPQALDEPAHQSLGAGQPCELGVERGDTLQGGAVGAQHDELGGAAQELDELDRELGPRLRLARARPPAGAGRIERQGDAAAEQPRGENEAGGRQDGGTHGHRRAAGDEADERRREAS